MFSNQAASPSRRGFLGKALGAFPVFALATSLLNRDRCAESRALAASALPPQAGRRAPQLPVVGRHVVSFSDATGSVFIKDCSFDALPTATVVIVVPYIEPRYPEQDHG
jgi:hypothetical protein